MNEIVYVLFPGTITSKTDGQYHYISAPQLARLYGLDYKICKIVYLGTTKGYVKKDNYVELYPRYDGNYPKLG